MEITTKSYEQEQPGDLSLTFVQVPFYQRFNRIWMTLLLLTSDIFALLASITLAVNARTIFGYNLLKFEFVNRMLPIVMACVLIYFLRGLYPGVGLSAVEELRRLAVSTSAVFLMATALIFWTQNADSFSRLVMALSWVFALILVQGGRWLARLFGIQFGLWGEPVAAVGYGPQGKRVVRFLLKNMRLGLRPVVILDGFEGLDNSPAPIPQIRLSNLAELDKLNEFLYQSGIRTAILMTSEMPEALQEVIVNQKLFRFNRLILISDLGWIGSVGVNLHDLEGFLGLEVRHNLLHAGQRSIKRVMEISLVVVGGILFSPLLMLIAFLISADSPGGIFYNQIRIGRGGRTFKMWKFRTMVKNADAVLEKYLKENPHLREEWNATQKIKNDPRVTRVGRFLRKLSLDELPQLYNVLAGDMSVVGPRPFFPKQKPLYGKAFDLYTRVRPGMTGLWQVSGRNSTTFAERALWDEYYVRQWSIWLDIYILIRTVWVVLRRDGAY